MLGIQLSDPSSCVQYFIGVYGNVTSLTLCNPKRHHATALKYMRYALYWHKPGLTLEPPEGWCIMILLFGNDLRVPWSPAHNSSDAIEQACPMHSVLTGLRIYCSNSQLAG